MVRSTGKFFSATSFSPHDPQIGDAHGHGLRNVVVAQVEHLHRESVGAGDEFALAFGDADACFREQADALLVESAFGLNCYSQHVCLLFFRTPACGTDMKKPIRRG